MRTSIYHSVNSGLFFWSGNDGLLLDGLHQGGESGCSPMPDALTAQLRCGCGLFAHITGLLFTHLHGDHYDAAYVDSLRNIRPELPVYTPEVWNGTGAKMGENKVRLGAAWVYAQRTLHDGAQFREVPHYSYLLQMGAETFLIAGDAQLTPEDAEKFQSFQTGGRITAGFFNPYQLLSPSCQAFLRLLSLERIFLIHLPFPRDDIFHYWALARQSIERFPPELPPVEQLKHMAWRDDKPAPWAQMSVEEEK